MINSVTVKDVAQEANVSVGTVSRVFNNHENVTHEIRQRVLEAAKTLGYSRQVSQDVPRNRPLKEIGFLYSSMFDQEPIANNPFWSHILHGVENEARKFNIKVTYGSIGELARRPQQLISAVRDMKLGGILLVGPAELETIQLLQSLDLPLILVDNHAPELSVDSVLCDNFEGARMAVNYLVSEGHQQIAFIGGPVSPGSPSINKIYTIERRALGYRTALLDAGLPIRPELYEAGNLSTEGGYQACKRLLESKVSFSAIFCANDETAIGAMKALREAGRRLPEDVSLIGFDDIALVEHLMPALTTIRLNKEALGTIAIRNLLALASDPVPTRISSVLEVELIKRDSVGPWHM